MQRNCCYVLGCNSKTSQSDITFYWTPDDVNMRTKWLEKMQRLEEYRNNLSTLPICEKHFEKKYINLNRQLMNSAIPTLYLPISGSSSSSSATPIASTSTLDEGTPNQSELMETDQAVIVKEEPEDVLYEVMQQVEMPVQITSELLPQHTTNLRAPKKKSKTQKYSDEFKISAMKMYFTSPYSYQSFQSSFELPTLSILHKLCISKTTELNYHVLTALKMKVDTMTQVEKQCVVCIGSISLTPNVFYDVNSDKMVGFHEVDGVQMLEPANIALVILLRGLFHNWKQVIAFSFISKFQNCQDVKRFIHRSISKLLNVGLNVRALMINHEAEKFIGGKDVSLSPETPYISIGNRKIYYFYDFLYMMRNIREYLMEYNFIFNNGPIAKWEHIVQCYNHDRLRQLFRVAPKLSQEHIEPVKDTPDDVKKSLELFSKATAIAISLYVEMKVMDIGAMCTVQWIVTMNSLIEMLNFNTIDPPENKTAVFTGQPAQVDFLVATLTLFFNLRFISLSPHGRKSEIVANSSFCEPARLTINAMLLLYGELKTENCWHPPVVGLSRDCLDDFFNKVCQKHGNNQPTIKEIVSFKYPNFDIFSYFTKKKPLNDLDSFMLGMRQIADITKYTNSSVKVKKTTVISAKQSDEFSKVLLENKTDMKQLALYLLHKAYQRHKHCDKANTYACGADAISIDSDHDNSKYNITKFVNFIESLEEKFKKFFKRRAQFTKVFAGLETSIKDVVFEMPCECFPLDYVKGLYLKFKLYLLSNGF